MSSGSYARTMFASTARSAAAIWRRVAPAAPSAASSSSSSPPPPPPLAPRVACARSGCLTSSRYGRLTTCNPTSSPRACAGASATHRTPADRSSVRAYAARAILPFSAIAPTSAVNAAVAPACVVSSSGTINRAGRDSCIQRSRTSRSRNPNRWIPSAPHARFASERSFGVSATAASPYSTHFLLASARATSSPCSTDKYTVSAWSSVRSLE
eukprot:31190-Pelagococcus_subviridis.AAC.9